MMPCGWKPFLYLLFGAKTEPTSGFHLRLAPKRSQLSDWFVTRLRFGANIEGENSSRSLTATFGPPKRHFFWKSFCISFSPVLFGLPEVFPRFLPPPPYRNIESRKTTRFFKKSSYYITEACTPQKTTSNFVFLKTFSAIWTTTLKGLKTTANCSFFQKVSLLSYRNIERSFFNPRFKKDF